MSITSAAATIVGRLLQVWLEASPKLLPMTTVVWSSNVPSPSFMCVQVGQELIEMFDDVHLNSAQRIKHVLPVRRDVTVYASLRSRRGP